MIMPGKHILSVFASNGVHGAMQALAPQFERESGARLAFTYGTANEIAARIGKGERGDVAIVTQPILEALQREGITAAGRLLAKSGAGVGVRAGATRPAIDSVVSFKHALLAAPSITYTRLGASGVYFAGLIERLGIADAIKAKAVIPDGGLVGEVVMAGRAAMAIQQIPELKAVAGIDIVGPFPPELQVYTVMAAAAFAEAPQADAARAFVEFLASPAALAVFCAQGMEAA